jgi:hypothetical protein
MLGTSQCVANGLSQADIYSLEMSIEPLSAQYICRVIEDIPVLLGDTSLKVTGGKEKRLLN